MRTELPSYMGFELWIDDEDGERRGYARLRHLDNDEESLGLGTGEGDKDEIERRLRELVDIWREAHGDDWERGLLDG